jgi:hypothetical protein
MEGANAGAHRSHGRLGLDWQRGASLSHARDGVLGQNVANLTYSASIDT